jgi:exopolysaccharide biosynthesis polyprenyl glycosylphosphotransferase
MEAAPVTTAVAAGRDEPAVRPLGRRLNRDSALRRMLAGADALAVLGALVITEFTPLMPRGTHAFALSLVAVPLMLVLFKLYGLYDRDAKRISHGTVDDLPWLFHATVIGTLLLWLYSRYTPMRRLDFIEVVLFGAGVVALVSGLRVIVRIFASVVIGRERAVLVGSGAMVEALIGKLDAHPEYQLEVVGSLVPDVASQADGHVQLPTLGTLDQLERVAAEYEATRVILSARELDDGDLEPLLRRCRLLSLKVSVLPKLSDVMGPGVAVDDVEGVTVLGINPPWLPRSSRALKRMMDLFLATALLVLSAPLIAIAAIAIKLDSRGPVFFRQIRVGRRGQRFGLYKFRTMVADAEERRAELLDQSTDPNWLKLDHDPRITRSGRLLRRLSLDELPQLWNVLRGQMSMVGPRPLIEAEDELVEPWARRRLDLTPGITGYWQVLGRTRIPFEEMVKLDYLYVMNWSLWEDVRLMLRTLPIVLAGRGAN